MRRLLLSVSLASACLLVACGSDSGAPDGAPTFNGADLTSVDVLLDSVLARFESNFAGTEGFEVRAGGMSASFAALPDSGLDLSIPALTPVDIRAVDPNAGELLMTYLPNVRRLATELRSSEMNGPMDRNGARVYAITSDDPSALLGGLADPAAEENRTLTVFVDASTFSIREIQQAMTSDTLARPVSIRHIYDNFKYVENVWLPFTVRQVKEGVDQLLTQEMRMVQGGQLTLSLGQMKANLPEGPERDRQVAEVERQLRAVTDGIDDISIDVDRVRFQSRDAADAP